MKSIKSFLLFFIFFTLKLPISYSQKRTQITIELDNKIPLSAIKILFDDGKENIQISPVYKNHSISIKGVYYSEYAVISVLYPRGKKSYWIGKYFINKPTAKIKVFHPDSSANPFLNTETINAIVDNQMLGFKQMQPYISDAEKDLLALYSDTTGKIENYEQLELKLSQRLYNGKLNFIKKYGNYYYSFWCFRTDLLQDFTISNVDTLMAVFNSFPSKFRNSIEGGEIKKLLDGRLFVSKITLAPSFIAKDINGNVIKLNNNNSTYFLLNFWASWCSPCIKEIPLLKDINNAYKSKVTLISVSEDSDYEKFMETIKKHNMTWVHIFGDKDLIKKYGNTLIPATYLINKNGEVVYNSFIHPEEQLIMKLEELLLNQK